MHTSSQARCDGVSRRDLFRIGGLTALGLTLADWFRLRALAAPAAQAKARSCILIWLDGGPSHLETFDLKPEAPQEVRGPFSPIATRVPGIDLCEFMPRTAQAMDKIAVIRSVTSPLGEHNFGAHYLLTGYKPTPVLQYPSFGAVVAHVRNSNSEIRNSKQIQSMKFQISNSGADPQGAGSPANELALPPYIAVPDYNAQAGQGYLPASCRPFAVGGDPAKPDFQVRDLSLYPEVTPQRLARRRDFLAAFDRFHRDVESAAPADPQFEQAYRLIASPETKAAFDLAREPAEVRARYGPRTIGQSCLLARRLVEAGVPFVTVTDLGWDTHDRLYNRLKEGYTGGTVGKIPSLDQAYAALLEDLAERGLLDETLVLLMGEFGRTPKLNAAGGRDHWPRAFSVALAGGGVRGGRAIGQSDSRGESPAERPVTPSDLARSVYTLLGIDPDQEFVTADGRPVRVNQGGQMIGELV
jgi:hypothetical protein